MSSLKERSIEWGLNNQGKDTFIIYLINHEANFLQFKITYKKYFKEKHFSKFTIP